MSALSFYIFDEYIELYCCMFVRNCIAPGFKPT